MRSRWVEPMHDTCTATRENSGTCARPPARSRGARTGGGVTKRGTLGETRKGINSQAKQDAAEGLHNSNRHRRNTATPQKRANEWISQRKHGTLDTLLSSPRAVAGRGSIKPSLPRLSDEKKLNTHSSVRLMNKPWQGGPTQRGSKHLL